MSLAIVFTRAQSGISAPLVRVEVHLSRGLPSFAIVGLPEKTVKESKERVRSAILNNQFEFPIKRITVNLAPADLPKDGGRFDLPIAIGILMASKQIPNKNCEHLEFIGELSLNGELREVSGVLPMTIATHQSNRAIVLTKKNAMEAALIKDANILPAEHLLEVTAHLTEVKPIQLYQPQTTITQADYDHDYAEVAGHESAKRAIEIAAAGGHHLLMMGPPGSGKTMLAERMSTIMPPMTEEQAIQSASIVSINHSFNSKNWLKRSFRSPHHSSSSAALVGGGSYPKPGEVSLAHHGILFLDELPEFERKVLEVLREPLESGRIVISRAEHQIEYPAEFQLIAAMNPCPCGFLGYHDGRCHCTETQVQRYQNKISGPLLDRIDIIIDVISMSTMIVNQTKQNEPSAAIRARVLKAYERQIKRNGRLNSRLINKEINKHCVLDEQQKKILQIAINKLNLSGRAVNRILKVSRTIADLADANDITTAHLAEAINYRKKSFSL